MLDAEAGHTSGLRTRSVPRLDGDRISYREDRRRFHRGPLDEGAGHGQQIGLDNRALSDQQVERGREDAEMYRNARASRTWSSLLTTRRATPGLGDTTSSPSMSWIDMSAHCSR